MTRIVGLDLSLTATGICGDAGPRVYTSKRRGMDRLTDILDNVYWDQIGDATDLVVLEGYSFGSRGAAVVSLGELGGVMRHTMHTNGCVYVEVPPSVLKKFATGKGNAGKPDMLAAAIRSGYDGPNDDNAVDAWWLRQMGVYAVSDTELPGVTPLAYRDEAVSKIEWPIGPVADRDRQEAS